MSQTSSMLMAQRAVSKKKMHCGFSSRQLLPLTTCTCWYATPSCVDLMFPWHMVACDHHQGFSSRDFKLENCGLVPGRMAERPLLKLMDFASSKVRCLSYHTPRV